MFKKIGGTAHHHPCFVEGKLIECNHIMAKILGIKIDGYNFREVMAKIRLFLRDKKTHQIVTLNPEFVLAAQKDIDFKKVLNNADLSIPDGFGLKIGAAILGQKIGERLTGVDLTWELAKLAAENGYSIFFLGAKEGVAKKAAQNIKLVHRSLKIAGTYAGDPNDKTTLDILKKTKFDILLVAFGAPKQDKFIYNLKYGFPQLTFPISHLPKIAVGVGGTFDYIAGIVPRAPRWLRNLGLEWLYRLFTQPHRFGRIFRAVIIFPALVIYKRFN